MDVGAYSVCVCVFMCMPCGNLNRRTPQRETYVGLALFLDITGAPSATRNVGVVVDAAEEV